MDTTLFRKRNVVVLIVTVIIVSVAVSTSTTQYIHYAGALTRSNITTGMMGGNKLNMSIGASGPNITGSVSLAPLIAKAIASRVNVSLVNAATIGEKAVGTNAHAVSIRLAVIHGFLVYRALIIDGNYGFHTVLVDAGNGKVLSSAPLSIANMLMHRGMLMRNGMMSGPGMGITFGRGSNTTGVNNGSSNSLGLKSPTQ